jgi:hypothetical protein
VLARISQCAGKTMKLTVRRPLSPLDEDADDDDDDQVGSGE